MRETGVVRTAAHLLTLARETARGAVLARSALPRSDDGKALAEGTDVEGTALALATRLTAEGAWALYDPAVSGRTGKPFADALLEIFRLEGLEENRRIRAVYRAIDRLFGPDALQPPADVLARALLQDRAKSGSRGWIDRLSPEDLCHCPLTGGRSLGFLLGTAGLLNDIRPACLRVWIPEGEPLLHAVLRGNPSGRILELSKLPAFLELSGRKGRRTAHLLAERGEPSDPGDRGCRSAGRAPLRANPQEPSPSPLCRREDSGNSLVRICEEILSDPREWTEMARMRARSVSPDRPPDYPWPDNSMDPWILADRLAEHLKGSVQMTVRETQETMERMGRVLGRAIVRSGIFTEREILALAPAMVGGTELGISTAYCCWKAGFRPAESQALFWTCPHPRYDEQLGRPADDTIAHIAAAEGAVFHVPFILTRENDHQKTVAETMAHAWKARRDPQPPFPLDEREDRDALLAAVRFPRGTSLSAAAYVLGSRGDHSVSLAALLACMEGVPFFSPEILLSSPFPENPAPAGTGATAYDLILYALSLEWKETYRLRPPEVRAILGHYVGLALEKGGERFFGSPGSASKLRKECLVRALLSGIDGASGFSPSAPCHAVVVRSVKEGRSAALLEILDGPLPESADESDAEKRGSLLAFVERTEAAMAMTPSSGGDPGGPWL